MDRSITTDLLKKITGSRVWMTVFLLYTGAIFYLALKPMDPQGAIGRFSGLDKLLHGGEFVIYFLIGFKALEAWGGVTRGKLAALIVTSLLFAGVTEISQMAVSYRSASIADWIADLAGIAVGCAATRLLSAFTLEREKG